MHVRCIQLLLTLTFVVGLGMVPHAARARQLDDRTDSAKMGCIRMQLVERRNVADQLGHAATGPRIQILAAGRRGGNR